MSDLFATFAHLFEPVRALAGGRPVYLVGGAVRDAMLGRPLHDLDFVLLGDAGALARKVADALQAPFYMLDKERDTARVIHGGMVLDFAVTRAPTLESDLRARDFTINALAVDLNSPQRLIDPLAGAADVRLRVLRACSASAFTDDPARVLRAVRQALELQFRVLPETARAIHAAAPLLARVSPERQRDELFRMLAGPRVGAAVRLLRHFGALAVILPETAAMPAPAQEFSLAVARELEGLLALLTDEYQPDKAANFARTAAALWLGRFRSRFSQHLGPGLNPMRPTSALLILAALLLPWDQAGATGDVSQGASTSGDQRGRALALSSVEVDRLKAAMDHRDAFQTLARDGGDVSRREVYRFFKHCGPAGVEVILLSLARTLAEYAAELPIDLWEHELAAAQVLLAAWWEKPSEQVRPPLLLNGRDVMRRFGLPAGPRVGDLLELLEEAQATGEVLDRESALQFIGDQLDQTSK